MREPSTAGQSLHDLPARPGNVHWGYFDASLAPALRVRCGDLIRAEAITHHAGDAPELMMDADIRALYAAIPEHDRAPGVHIMTGPIHVADAMPGDMLEVRYLEMVPRLAYGSNLAAHWGYLYREMAERERVTIFRIDRATNQAAAVFAYDVAEKYTVPGRITDCAACRCEPALRGVHVPVRPHIGTAGVAPNATGRISSVPPGLHGGNIDNWRIGAGATMFYPVQVDGALFSIGDPHISQGDGEISGTAIEASLARAVPHVRKDFRFPRRCLRRRAIGSSRGFDEDLNVAMRNASVDMMELLTEQQRLSRDDAYSLMSVAADFAVTQVVDGRQGIHCRIARGVFSCNGPDPDHQGS